MQQASPLIQEIDSALGLLKNSQRIELLQSLDALLSRVVEEAVEGTTYHTEWAAPTVPIEAIRVIIGDLSGNLERTRHEQLPEPLPSVLLELLRHVRGVAETLQEHRETRVSEPLPLESTLQHRITGHELELKELLSNIKKSVEPKLIYDISLDELVHPTTVLDITAAATPHRYRLVECSPLAERGILRIWEFTYFPSVSYSTISYVWRGNIVRDDFSKPEFSVRGAEDADPIGTEVLHDACVASLGQGAPYLWLDRLCIMQTSGSDKNWQISKMYDLYRFCSLCIIIPGGLRRLVSLQEETQWIHRGWTLQEALAPPVVRVLFSWTWSFGNIHATPALEGTSDAGEITEVVKGRSAMAPLGLVLDGCIAGSVWFYEFDTRAKRPGMSEKIRLFGAAPVDHHGNDFQFALPGVAALALATSRSMQEDYDRKCYTIWKCALMRASSRPVDMVFSTMGLFDVSLDIGQFDKNDRVGATIALTQEVLRRGGRANWLGLCFHAPPSPYLSMFPAFPRTSVAGKALVRVGGSRYVEISKLMDNEYPNSEVLGAMPRGSMDADGYFTFEAKSIRLFRISTREGPLQEGNSPKPQPPNVPDGRRFKATNGVEWEAYEGEFVHQEDPHSSEWQGQNFAALLGCFFGYTPTKTMAYDCNNVRGMILQEHTPGKYHLDSYFMLSIRTIDWVVSWAQRSFCVGGPGRFEPGADDDGVIDEVDAVERYVPPPDRSIDFGTIQSKHVLAVAREARRRELGAQK